MNGTFIGGERCYDNSVPATRLSCRDKSPNRTAVFKRTVFATVGVILTVGVSYLVAEGVYALSHGGRAETSLGYGVLAHVLNEIKAANINVQQMENTVFAGAEAAIARIELEGALSPEKLDRIRSGNSDIIELNLLAI